MPPSFTTPHGKPCFIADRAYGIFAVTTRGVSATIVLGLVSLLELASDIPGQVASLGNHGFLGYALRTCGLDEAVNQMTCALLSTSETGWIPGVDAVRSPKFQKCADFRNHDPYPSGPNHSDRLHPAAVYLRHRTPDCISPGCGLRAAWRQRRTRRNITAPAWLDSAVPAGTQVFAIWIGINDVLRHGVSCEQVYANSQELSADLGRGA